MSIRVREGRFTVDIRHAGTRYRLAVPDDRQTRRGAEAYERAVLADLAKGIDPRQPKLAPTLTEYSDEYLAGVKRTCRDATHSARESLLRVHILPQLGSVRLDQLRSRHVLKLRDAMAETCGPGTTRNAITTLRHMVRAWYTARDEQGPLLTGQVRRYNPAPKFYSAAEIEKLIAAAREHEPMVLALVLLGADAGLRCGEMTALRWGDLAEGWINVSRSRSPCGRTEGPTKSGRERQVPMTARLVAALEALPRSDEDDHVLLVDGVGANHTHARRRLAKAQVTAGMAVTGMHALRHSYCSTLALSGAPVHLVKALAGHAHLAVTERYLHHRRGDLVAAVKALGHKMGTPGGSGVPHERHGTSGSGSGAGSGTLCGRAGDPLLELQGREPVHGQVLLQPCGASHVASERAGAATPNGVGAVLGTPCDHVKSTGMDPDAQHAALLATFAANVRHRAAALKMSLSDVAERAGIPRATLHAILSARRTPTLITLTKIGAAIGCDVVELFIDDTKR